MTFDGRIKPTGAGKNTNGEGVKALKADTLRTFTSTSGLTLQNSAPPKDVLELSTKPKEESLIQKIRNKTRQVTDGVTGQLKSMVAKKGPKTNQFVYSKDGDVFQKVTPGTDKSEGRQSATLTDKGSITQRYEDTGSESSQSAEIRNGSVDQVSLSQDTVIQNATVSASDKATIIQQAPDAKQAIQIIKSSTDDNVTTVQEGNDNPNMQEVDLNNSNNIEIHQNTGGGHDAIDNTLTGSSNNKLTIQGGTGEEMVRVKLEDDSSNNTVTVYGNSQDVRWDNEIDSYELDLSKLDASAKGNKFVINPGVEGSKNDRLSIRIRNNDDISSIRYDKESKILYYKGNEIHTGGTLDSITIESNVTRPAQELIDEINNNPDLTQDEKAKRLEQIKAKTNKPSDPVVVAKDKKFISFTSDPLPEKFHDMVTNKSSHKNNKNNVISTMEQIYSDPEGRLLLEKLAENGTKIEIIDKIDEKDFNGGVAGFFSPDDNKIVLVSPNTTITTLVHEMGHAVTGVKKGNAITRLFDSSLNNSDGNSIKEEISTDLLGTEINARIQGREMTQEEYKEAAKSRLQSMIMDGDNKAVRQYSELEPDNGFNKHINKWTGVTVEYDPDPGQLYKEIKAEDTTGKVPRIKQLEE